MAWITTAGAAALEVGAGTEYDCDAGRGLSFATEYDHRSSARVDPMFDAMTWAGVWLAQRAGALPDTVFTKQIASEPSMFDRVTGIASGLLTIAVCAFVVAAIPAAWNFRKSY